MEMNWITNLVVFIVGLFDRYDNFVKRTAVKHLWVASALNVVGSFLFGIVFIGVPVLIISAIIMGAIKLAVLFPFFSCIFVVTAIFALAMIYSAGSLAANLPKVEETPTTAKVDEKEEKQRVL